MKKDKKNLAKFLFIVQLIIGANIFAKQNNVPSLMMTDTEAQIKFESVAGKDFLASIENLVYDVVGENNDVLLNGWYNSIDYEKYESSPVMGYQINFHSLESESNYQGYNGYNGIFFVGLDGNYGPGTKVGMIFLLANSDTDLKGGSRLNAQSQQLNWHYAYQAINKFESMVVPYLGAIHGKISKKNDADTVSANYYSQYFGVLGKISRKFDAEIIYIIPSLIADYGIFYQDSISEIGKNISLEVPEQEIDKLNGTLALKIGKTFMIKEITGDISINGSYKYEFMDITPQTTVTISGTETGSYKIPETDRVRGMKKIGSRFNARMRNFDTYIDFTYGVAGQYSNSLLSLGIDYNF
ncbi:MAG: autotransporter outer membrane beta-barrel domain-containing protein [Fusobacteriaceae bacterium]